MSMPAVQKEENIFKQHLPLAAVPYCMELWRTLKFSFIITRKRKSKLGDYLYDPATGRHRITVNHNLNPYSFLVTYIHEVAHLTTRVNYKRNVAPHGREWKAQYKKLMEPLLNAEVFPANVLGALKQYMQDPKASSCADVTLLQALQQFDAPGEGVPVASLPDGSTFEYDRKVFIKSQTRRTRIQCYHPASGRNYSFSAAALVIPVEAKHGSIPLPQKPGLTVSDIEVGAKFRFRGNTYVRHEKQRTRIRCMEASSGRYFLIPGDAPVELV
jgi:SprT protein